MKKKTFVAPELQDFGSIAEITGTCTFTPGGDKVKCKVAGTADDLCGLSVPCPD